LTLSKSQYGDVLMFLWCDLWCDKGYIPPGITSSMVYSIFGFAIPLYCLWHSERSSKRPKGISHTSSCERCSCANQ